MSWKNLKIFAIAVLFVMNLFFGIEVYMQNKRMNFYSEKEIASVRGLLSESGLQVKEDYLRAKKVSPPAYMRRYGDGELLASVKSVFGNVESDGDALTAVSGGIYRFGAGDGFEYRSSEDSPLPEEILENGNVSAIFMFDSYSERLEAAMKKVMRIESINALPQNKKAEKTSASLYRLYVTDDGKYFVSVFLQYIGKMQTSQAFSLVIDADGNVVSGNGTFSLLLPTEKLKTDCVDLLTILFDEKRWADEYFSQPAQSTEQKKNGLELSALYYSYDVYHAANGAEYYVPVINLIYSDGTSHSYNLIDGVKK